MPRKLLALLAATFLVFGLLPAASAFASALGTATLTSARTTFPVDNTTASIRVTSAEPPVVGKAINYVDIIIPAGTAGVVLDERAISAPTGWTATKDVVGNFQAVTFKSSTTGIQPGQNQVFNIPVDITRPANSDRAGTYNVAISSNGGANTRPGTANPAGTLDIAVKILEIVGGTMGATSPVGVTDNSATGGQSITYGFGVRNHAQQAVSVTPTLSSSDPTDVVSGSGTVSVPGDPTSVTSVSRNVALGPAKTADRTSIFTATATSSGASAAPQTRPLTVQMEPDLNFTQLEPNRVRSGTGANYSFRVTGSKTGSPALYLDGATLRFGSNTATTPGVVNYNPGNQSQAINFQQIEVAGGNGPVTATVSVAGRDANDKAFGVTKGVDPTLIIDNIAPIVKDIAVSIPSGQTAVKSGDLIQVTGCLDTADNDLRTSTLRVVLDPDVGNDVVITPSTTANANGCDYTFSGSASPTWAAGATRFVAVAEVSDIAGNIGAAQSAPVIIDLLPPALQDFGRTESAREIRVQFLDNLVTSIDGGCDPTAWRVNGAPVVEQVRYTDGRDCLGQEPDGSGVRILYLRAQAAMDQDDRPPVTYDENELLNDDPAQDGARNDALTRTIQTVSGIKPAAPSIVTIERNNGSETAYSESDATDNTNNYYTRFRGTGDPATEDLLVSFGGARNDYLIQVVDGAGRVLFSDELQNPSPISTSPEFNSDVRVPIGTGDGTYRRGIRLVASGNEGDISWFDVVLDTRFPVIANQSLQSDGQTVVVNFNEPLVGGTDFAQDWVALESTSEGDTYYSAMDVISTDADTRTITFPLQNSGAFRQAHYHLRSDNGIRYEDRGGNQFADTLTLTGP